MTKNFPCFSSWLLLLIFQPSRPLSGNALKTKKAFRGAAPACRGARPLKCHSRLCPAIQGSRPACASVRRGHGVGIGKGRADIGHMSARRALGCRGHVGSQFPLGPCQRVMKQRMKHRTMSPKILLNMAITSFFVPRPYRDKDMTTTRMKPSRGTLPGRCLPPAGNKALQWSRYGKIGELRRSKGAVPLLSSPGRQPARDWRPGRGLSPARRCRRRLRPHWRPCRGCRCSVWRSAKGHPCP